ncbi:MAG: DUF86 domain-containing protein [Ignavibacteria bacterium]|nr:DUF86 domain-containing protein [Ignavibacteria bacterium]
MFDKNVLHLLTILEAVEKIHIYSKDFPDADSFFENKDQLNYNATINLLIAIGEERKKIDEQLRNKYDIVNWNEVAGLRNILSHNYTGIDNEIIWDIIKNYLGSVKDCSVKLLIDLINTKQLRANLTEILNSKYYSHIKYLTDIINNKGS